MRYLLLTIFLVLLEGISCSSVRKKQPVEEIRFMMDTVVRISVYDQELPERKIKKVIDRAFERMARIEAIISVSIDTSYVTRISEESGVAAVNVSPEVLALLKSSVEVSKKTRGAFDITIGVIKNQWGFDSDHAHVPEISLIHSLLPLVNYRNIQFADGKVMLTQPGMRIDLGGIAKGYIIDQGVEVLQDEGIDSGIVEAGGDLRIFGHHPYRKIWRIGIRHPRKGEGKLIGVLETNETSIATSGDYERYFIQDGKRYHHILDPKTGFPARGCASVTIVTKNALLADGYATGVFVLGPKKGIALIDSLPSIEGLIIYTKDDSLKHVVSQGFRQNIHFYPDSVLSGFYQ